MLIANLEPEAGLVNGSRGVVVEFEVINETENRPVVKFLNGLTRLITHHLWEFEINDEIVVKRSQLPLILGFASTIHKSQGLTIDCIEVDLGNTIFAAGQFYTALSRVKSLEGLKAAKYQYKSL